MTSLLINRAKKLDVSTEHGKKRGARDGELEKGKEVSCVRRGAGRRGGRGGAGGGTWGRGGTGPNKSALAPSPVGFDAQPRCFPSHQP